MRLFAEGALPRPVDIIDQFEGLMRVHGNRDTARIMGDKAELQFHGRSESEITEKCKGIAAPFIV
jgi:hypothetical protein